MAAEKKLTKRFVEGIAPLEHQEILIWDIELRGFGLRVFPSGRKTYFIQYRNQLNRTRRIKIGLHGVITTEQAREDAKKILVRVVRGEDPSQIKRQFREKPTMDHLADAYLEMHAKIHKKPQGYREDKSMFDNIVLKKWTGCALDTITSHDIQMSHRVLRRIPYRANRVLALLSKAFNLAVQWKWCTENPVRGVQKYQEQKRTRWLNDKELKQLLKVLDQYCDQNIANIIRLLLLTGSRTGEVLKATWDQFNLEAGVWTKPAHTTKQKRMAHLPLSLHTITLLKTMKQTTTTKHLFPGKVEGKPLYTIKNSWDTIRKRAMLEDVRLHDLRHTHASHLVSQGLSLNIVGQLLGHTQASTTYRYAHLADQTLRDAAEVFGRTFERITHKGAE